MTEMMIFLITERDAVELIGILSKYSFDIDMVLGRYVIDAKSIMGIFSVDLSKAVDLRIHAEGTEAEKAMEVISPFIEK